MRNIVYLLVFMLFMNSALTASASDNADLLSTEPTVMAPDFDARTFATCSEFESTMEKILPKQDSYYWRGGPVMLESTTDAAARAPAPTMAPKSDMGAGANTPHSETNVQVAGIDEADSVKTDGTYIYSYQVGENGIVILDAKNLNKIKTIKIPTNYSNSTFYIQKGKLILTATRYVNSSRYWMGWYDNSQKSIVAIYDVSTPASAKLVRLTQVDGSLSDTRLEDNGLMTAVVSTSYWTPPYYRMMMEDGKTPTYNYSDRNLVPRISDVIYNGTKRIATNRAIADCKGMTALLPSEKTLDTYSFSPTLTSIVRLDTSVYNSKISSQVVLSQAGQVHVSRDSIYLTSNLWTPYNTSTTGKCAPDTPCAASMIWNPGVSGTLVHRFVFDRLSTKYVYSTLVPGNPLTQYSMDEDVNKNFRIVTSEWGDTQSTRLTVIGSTGKVVGKLAGIAPGENFQSSRFIGDRLYLVTFEQIDPLFVVSLANPASPSILGELKIPGYSTYLHPYDANRLIGVGYDTKTNQWGGTQNAGIKVDLYNVSDVKNPKQEATLTLGDVGSSSDVLWNPRAFVYYKEKRLLLMPATLMTSAGDPDNSYLAKSAFQGLVGLSLEPGKITEKFRVSHIEKSESMNTDWKNTCKNQGYGSWTPAYCKVGATLDLYLANNLWNYSSQFVNRVLYVGESLYTIGESRIQMQNFASPTVPTAIQKFKAQSQNVGYPIAID